VDFVLNGGGEDEYERAKSAQYDQEKKSLHWATPENYSEIKRLSAAD